MAGGAPEGAAGRRLCRVCGGRPGSDQTLRPAAADHAAGHRQRHQGGRGPHPAAQVVQMRLYFEYGLSKQRCSDAKVMQSNRSLKSIQLLVTDNGAHVLPTYMQGY